MDRIIAAKLIEHLACVGHCAKHFTRVSSLNTLNDYETGSSADPKKAAASRYFSWS